jgi:hypothetical protein
VTSLEDDMVTALAKAGPEFRRTLKAGSIGKLYQALLAHTCLPTLKLISMRGARDYTHAPRVYSTSVDFSLDYHSFEDDLVESLAGENFAGLSVESIEEAVMTFYACLAKAMDEAEKPFVISKPGTGAQSLLAAREFFQGRKPKVLYIVRDPRGVVCSHATKRIPPLLFAQEWRTDIQALEALKHHYPVYMVHYEKLCLNTKGEMGAVADFIGVDFEDVFLKPTMRGQRFTGNSSFKSFGGEISTASIERWKTALDQSDIHEIEDAASAEMERLGYVLLEPMTTGRQFRNMMKALGSVICKKFWTVFRVAGTYLALSQREQHHYVLSNS